MTTALHPRQAIRKDSGSRKSPTTSSASDPANTVVFDVRRTNARTGTPSFRKRHTMALPSLPVEPTTKTNAFLSRKRALLGLIPEPYVARLAASRTASS